MFATRFFGARFFATRYWCKVGATLTFNPRWAINSNRTVGLMNTPND